MTDLESKAKKTEFPSLRSLIHKTNLFLQKDLAISKLLAIAKFIISLPFLGASYYIVDEPQYIAESCHLSLGYVDDAPLLIWLTALPGSIFGYSPASIRILPLIACSLSIIAIGYLAKLLGGGIKAQALASMSFLGAPYIVESSMYLMVPSYEPLLYTLIFIYICKFIKNEDNDLKHWLLFSSLLAIAVLNKYTITVLTACIFFALCLNKEKKILQNPYFYMAIIIEVLALAPCICWWSSHDWSGIYYLIQCAARANDIADLLLDVFPNLSTIIFLICLAGFAYLLFFKKMRKYRALGLISFLFVQFFLLFRSDLRFYLSGIAVMSAAGSVFVEKYINRLVVPLCTILAVNFIACMLAFTIPIYNENAELFSRSISYISLGVCNIDARTLAEMNRVGHSIHWKEKLSAISHVYSQLDKQKQDKAVLITFDSGLHGAALLDKDIPLPVPISNHHSAWYWGLPNMQITTVIGANVNEPTKKLLNQYFRDYKDYHFPIYYLDGTFRENYHVEIWDNPIKPNIIKDQWDSFKDFSR